MSKKRKKNKGYDYDTPVSTIAKDCGINFDVPPETKLGDFFKDSGDVGLEALARFLKWKI